VGDVDADFHHQLWLYAGDVQCLPDAPAGGERPARPWMLAPRRSEQAGDREVPVNSPASRDRAFSQVRAGVPCGDAECREGSEA
jgi:hypothetical protein